MPWSQALLVIFGLGMFYVTPYRIAKYRLEVSAERMALMVAMNIIGKFHVIIGIKCFK